MMVLLFFFFFFLLIYVDDMLIVAKSMSEVNKLKIFFSREFDMKDLGAAKKILGMKIHKKNSKEIMVVLECLC